MEVFQYKFTYYGKGSDLFKIRIVNAILCIFTFGMYYPWAKAATLQYMYSQAAFQDQPFAFTGTGKEMFRGFLKMIVCLIVFYAIIICSYIYINQLAAVYIAYAMIIMALPLVIHSFFRYRMAKTKWQGINFRYEGRLGEFFSIYIKGVFFTIMTIGIYSAWLSMDLRRYIFGHVKIGDANIHYHGDGASFFLMNLKGYLLTVFTFGIYYFWWKKDQYDFFIANTNLTKGDKVVILKTNVGGGDFASLLIGNFFIVLFTLGLGTAWAITRKMNFYARHIDMYGDLDFNELQQTSIPEYSNATGDDLSSMFDIGSVI